MGFSPPPLHRGDDLPVYQLVNEGNPIKTPNKLTWNDIVLRHISEQLCWLYSLALFDFQVIVPEASAIPFSSLLLLNELHGLFFLCPDVNIWVQLHLWEIAELWQIPLQSSGLNVRMFIPYGVWLRVMCILYSLFQRLSCTRIWGNHMIPFDVYLENVHILTTQYHVLSGFLFPPVGL